MSADLPALSNSCLTIADRVATLELARDDVRNELTGTGLHAEIAAVADWVASRPEVSVLVLTGRGKSFSAGGNVKHMRDRTGSFGGSPYVMEEGYVQGIQRMALALHALEIPSIAAVNGAAIGAGFDLACMCDLRLASETATFGETFVNLGLIPGDGGAWFLQRLIGLQRAMELTFTGRVFSAQQALDYGLLLEVIAPEALAARAAALAVDIAGKPAHVLRLTKRLMRSAGQTGLSDLLKLSAAYQSICHTTADHMEAVEAFLEKRPPKFVGR